MLCNLDLACQSEIEILSVVNAFGILLFRGEIKEVLGVIGAFGWALASRRLGFLRIIRLDRGFYVRGKKGQQN